MSLNRRSFDRPSDHSFDCSSNHQYYFSHRTGSRSSNTKRRPYGFSSTAVGLLPEYENDFLTKVINAVTIDPQRALTPNCICCKAIGVKSDLRKHYFADCQFVKDNMLCQIAFKNVCGLVNSLSKKSHVSNSASQATLDHALNRLKSILDSSEDQLEDGDIESDDGSSVASHPDFPHGNSPVHRPSSQH